MTEKEFHIAQNIKNNMNLLSAIEFDIIKYDAIPKITIAALNSQRDFGYVDIDIHLYDKKSKKIILNALNKIYKNYQKDFEDL